MPKFSNQRVHIDALPIGHNGGTIGMCACPGARFKFSRQGDPLEDLPLDLDHLKAWGAHGLVSLIELDELQRLGVEELPDMLEQRGLWWMHLPIRDMKTPSKAFEQHWQSEASAQLHERFAAGERIAFHCMAGLGRTGLIAARLLIESGVSNQDAVRLVREARPGTIQTWRQLFHVRRYRPKAR